MATKGDELYFQDLSIYNKLKSLSKGGGKNRHPLRQETETNWELIRRQAEGEVVENAENWFKRTSDVNNAMVSDRKGPARGKARLRTISSGTP